MHNMPPSDWCRVRTTANILYPDYWRGSETGGGAVGLLSCNYNILQGANPPYTRIQNYPRHPLPQELPGFKCNRNRRDGGIAFAQVLASPGKTVKHFFARVLAANNRFPPSTGVSGSHHQTFFHRVKAKSIANQVQRRKTFAPSKAGIQKQSRAQ